MVYFANRGRENLGEMETDDYEFHTEEKMVVGIILEG